MKHSKNITIYKPDKVNFQKYLKICGDVLCTSDNELILECVLNKISNAIMPCSTLQIEQVHNCKKYVETLKYSQLLSKSLDLEYLVNKNMINSHLQLIENRNLIKNLKNNALNFANKVFFEEKKLLDLLKKKLSSNA